ncbi:hypothetical protein ZEAMMB73_Zm00001d009195 [Zea mays]|uniref:Uncharacterized protein n=1 Tax=Zea mays TaxID=4577 RepID=A0A1D6FI52_MAIZE|nr:hypothetical protein ZEAMMB73_Zm00001d009195 [Zea mays]
MAVGDLAFKALTAGLGVATLYLAATFPVNVYRGLSWHSEQFVRTPGRPPPHPCRFGSRSLIRCAGFDHAGAITDGPLNTASPICLLDGREAIVLPFLRSVHTIIQANLFACYQMVCVNIKIRLLLNVVCNVRTKYLL